MPVSVTSTRDLVRFRKLPASQTGISTLATNFFALLTTPDSPPAAYVRSAFVPALLNSTIKPRSSDEVQALDERIRTLFETPPAVVVAQGIINAEQIANAWKLGASAPIADSVFVVFALHQELESVRAEVDREQEANLSMMVLATLTYQCASWIFTKCHGYRPSGDLNSLHVANSSVGSLQSMQSSILGGSEGLTGDAGTRAISQAFGCVYELLSYAIGDRQVIKRRTGSRRNPSLTPPLVYQLIGDTPSILDATQMIATHPRWVVPWHDGDNMYAVVSWLTPAGSFPFHGVCSVREEKSEGQAVEFKVQLADQEEETGVKVYGGL